MEMDAETKAQIMQDITPLITGGVAAACVAGAASAALMLLGTNYKSGDLTGDKNITPTEDNTVISKAEAAASEKEGKVSQDKVTAQNGDLGASNTNAAAQIGDAKAVDSGATALRTKAGASDIETKALKMT